MLNNQELGMVTGTTPPAITAQAETSQVQLITKSGHFSNRFLPVQE